MSFYYYVCIKMRDVDGNPQQSVETETVAKSLPPNKVILLTRLISYSYVSYTGLRNIFGITSGIEY